MDQPKNRQSKCEHCNITFTSDKTKEEHLHGKKHLMIMHQVNSTKMKEELGIFVTGLPNMVSREEILAEFGKYGKVTHSFFRENNRFCIIQFDNPQPVEQLIKLEAIWLKGKKMKISKRIIKDREAAQAVYSSPVENFEEILKSIKNVTTFDHQLKRLIDQIQPGYHETRDKIYALSNDLENVLNEEFPRCGIYTFGSTITNLYLTNSDIDIYVEVKNIERNISPEVRLASLYVNRAKTILQRHGNIFTNICAIPNAKTPIVKFVHAPTNFKCDFNFKNMLGVCNSRLIHYYLLLDHKLTPLMIFIKYWAKVHDLVGLSGKFSNYSLALMFIFYLQATRYKLPPVSVLQTSTCSNMQDGWNGGFQRSQTYSHTLRDHSMIKVLLGFYEYYADFDYTLNIVCPYLGKTVPKTDFVQPDVLPSIFDLYKKNIKEEKPPLRIDSSVCVQDPFELNHNVAGSVNIAYMEEFVLLCKVAVTILKDSSLIKEAIHKLLTEEAEVFGKKFVTNDYQCYFKVPLSSTLLQVNDIISLKKVDATEKLAETVRMWQDELKGTAMKILKDIMKFNIVSNKDDTPDEKAQRRSGQKDIHDILNVSLHCHGFYNVWDGHRTIIKDIDFDDSASLLDRQLAITKYILDVLYKGEVLNLKIIEFSFNISFNETPAEATFSLKNSRSQPRYFRTFGSYFFKMLPLLFHARLIEIAKNLRISETSTIDNNS